MHIIHEEIGLPKITSQSTGEHSALFTIAPLPNGYGMTLGNALRRVLLSSVPGAAITAVRIEGVTHEYTTLTGVKDSILDVCLGLKQVALRKHSKGSEITTLNKKGKGDVVAKDIKVSSDIELLNPEMVITKLSEKAGALNMELKIDKGVGYIPAAEQQRDTTTGENWIYLDATFSPVTRVKYEVSATRVGENTDLDKLQLEVETNGSLTPEEAMKFAASVLQSYFVLFQTDEADLVEPDFMASFSTAVASREEDEDGAPQETYTPIEVLNLSPRTLNALINGEIGSVEELVKCSPAKLENLRGFGKKAMDEVREVLALRNLTLAEDE
mgnify:CR=1 FL=1